LIGAVSEINDLAKIIVVGVGGGGCNAVNRMIDSGAKDVEFIAINTDSQALDANKASRKIKLITDEDNPKGLGAGGRPDVGAAATQRAKNEISQALEGADMVFITAGMGGGTGTGGAPVVAAIAKEKKILTVAVVTKPFRMEGAKRMRYALGGIEELKKHVDTLIVIPNQKLKDITTQKTSFQESLKMADEVLRQGVIGIADIISNPGDINIDFADICTVMRDKGLAHMGVGTADKAEEAAELAIKSPLLETSLDGAQSVLINFCGSSTNLILHEMEDAVDLISEAIDADAEIFFGFTTLEEMKDQIIVTVIATGLPESNINIEKEKEKKKTEVVTPKVVDIPKTVNIKNDEDEEDEDDEYSSKSKRSNSDAEEDEDDFLKMINEKDSHDFTIKPFTPDSSRRSTRSNKGRKNTGLDVASWFRK